MAKYWVGGSGTWNNNSGGRWSYYSGGPGGYGNPASNEDAIFDANSGGGNINVATGRNCYNLLLNGFTGTFTGAVSTDLYIYGDTVTLTGPSGVSMPGNGPRLYMATNYTSNMNFYTYGSSMGNIYLNNGKNFTLQHHATCKNNGNINSNYGNMYFNGKDFTMGTFTNSYGYVDFSSGTTQIIQAGPLNNAPIAFIGYGTNISAGSATLRFTRAIATGALSSAINSSQTSLTLVDAYLDNNQTAWPSSGMIQIDNEIMTYSSTSGGSKNVTLYGLSRGLYYTTPASHDQYKPVLLLGPYFTTLTSDLQYYDGTMYVADNSKFQGNGFLEVGGEIIYYSSKSGSTVFNSLSRGYTSYGGTGAAYHPAGTVVRHAELSVFNFSGTFGNVEFGNSGGYMMYQLSNWSGVPTFNNVQAGPYLPANPIGMTYVNFAGGATINNFKLDGTRGIQGILSQPVYIKNISGSNTSTRVFIGTSYPDSTVLPYTYTGGDDFIF